AHIRPRVPKVAALLAAGGVQRSRSSRCSLSGPPAMRWNAVCCRRPPQRQHGATLGAIACRFASPRASADGTCPAQLYGSTSLLHCVAEGVCCVACVHVAAGLAASLRRGGTRGGDTTAMLRSTDSPRRAAAAAAAAAAASATDWNAACVRLNAL